MCGYESWTIKKAEHQKTDAFKLWCWKPETGFLESALDNKEMKAVYSKGNHPWMFSKDWCWSWSSNTAHLMRRANSLDKTLMLGKSEGRRRQKRQRMKWLDDLSDSMDMSLSKLQRWWRTMKPGVLKSTALQRVIQDWATEPQQQQCLSKEWGNKLQVLMEVAENYTTIDMGEIVSNNFQSNSTQSALWSQ